MWRSRFSAKAWLNLRSAAIVLLVAGSCPLSGLVPEASAEEQGAVSNGQRQPATIEVQRLIDEDRVRLQFHYAFAINNVPNDAEQIRGSLPKHDASQGIARHLQPNHLVPIDGVVAEAARQVGSAEGAVLEQVHRSYHWIRDRMRDSKQGHGWGRR